MLRAHLHVRMSTGQRNDQEPIRSVLIAGGTGAAVALAPSWFMRARSP